MKRKYNKFRSRSNPIEKIFFKIIFSILDFLRIDKFFRYKSKILNVYNTISKKPRAKYLCIFAAYDKLDIVAKHSMFYLKKIRGLGFDIVLVSTSSHINSQSLKQLKAICSIIIHRSDIGRDFASWRCGIFESGINWKSYKKILFANDSCYAPLFSLKPVLGKYKRGIVSITDSFEGKYHLMSYFLLFNQDAIRHSAFTEFWSSVRALPSILKPLIIRRYEIGLSQYFREKGFQLHAYIATRNLAEENNVSLSRLASINPMHYFWRYLIEKKRCPVMKVDLFRRYFIPHNDQTWRQVIAKTQYDINLILEHQNLQ